MLKAIIALCVIPLIGFLISIGILNSLAENLTLAELIQRVEYYCHNNVEEGCSQITNVLLLRTASIYSGLASIFIILCYFSLAKLAGTNREIISKLFPPLIPIILLLIAIQTIVQGAIITYGFYIGEAYFLGVVHYFLIGAVGIGAGIGALKMINSIFSASKKLEHTQIGKQIFSKENPKIWKLVTNIAKDIGAKPPDNIILGIEPTFYATAADVDVIGCGEKTLKGETLYLSLPLMRLFTLNELKAVIGHELGHFRAKDTEYSSKFAPIYMGFIRSMNSLADSESLANLPAFIVLQSMYETF